MTMNLKNLSRFIYEKATEKSCCERDPEEFALKKT